MTQLRVMIALGIIATLLGLGWYISHLRAVADDWKRSAAVYKTQSDDWERQAKSEQTVTVITETRDRNIAAATSAATTATEEIHDAPDLDSALASYSAGLERVREQGHAAVTDPAVDASGQDAGR